MTIQFKVAKRAEAGKKGGGIPKYYARATKRELIDIRKIADDLASMSSLSTADVIAVLYGLSEVIPEHIKDGRSVKLDNLGIFSATLQSEGFDTPEEVNFSKIKGIKLKFLPDKEIKKKLHGCSFSKSKKG